MKKLILTFWILIMVVWPVSLNAAENQKIIFSGSYSVDNDVIDADTAWLYIKYYDTFIDSVIVSAESEGWGGWYSYKHECTNDSAWGWSGRWVYVNNSLSKRTGEDATVVSARDSSYALEASVTAVRDTAQYLVTSDGDTNTDPFDADVDSVMVDISTAWAVNGLILTQGNMSRAYVWSTILNPDGKYITNSLQPIAPDFDNISGKLDQDTETTGFGDEACTGGGSEPLQVYVLNTADSSALNKIHVTVNTKYDASGTKYHNWTDGNGLATFGMSVDDEILMLANAPAWSITWDSILKGSGTETDTLWATQWSPGDPVSAEACSVYGWLYDVESDSIAGATIIFELISDQDTLYYDNVTYLRGRTIEESNQNGYWSINVIPNALLDTSSFYSVDIIRGHTTKPILEHYDVYVPDSATVKFNDLLINFNRKGK